MNRGVRVALLLVWLCGGCASQSRAPMQAAPMQSTAVYSTPAGASMPPSMGSVSVRETPTMTRDTAPQPSTPSVQMSATPVMNPRENLDGVSDGDDRVGAWESEIVRQQAVLGSSLSQCRDICAAASNVCTAAVEICRLTGDAVRTPVQNPRCVHARDACMSAGRRRDGSCPVCPSR
jgi:hypothetical protein